MIENKKILVLGMARSGYNVAKLLAAKNEVIVTDRESQDEKIIDELKSLGVTFIKSADATEILDESFDYLIRNPGILPTHPCLEKAKKLNILVTNEMEVSYHYLPKNVKIIGITGSNGKTTTTTILYNLLKLHHKSVVLGGNIGYPLSEIISKVHENDILVLEISDHQLYDLISFKTDISILTNLCPTHLDFHGNYENYIHVKKKIFNNHTKDNIAIINYGNEDSLRITKDIKDTKVYFNNEYNYYDDKGIYLDKKMILKLDEIRLKGTHNYENILASLLALREIVFDIDIIKDYLAKFNGVEHRIERVDVNSKIIFYNDSKSTNPTSTITALKTMDKPTRIILGGMDRLQDFNELNDYMDIVKKIYAIGEVTDKIEEYAKQKSIPCVKCYTLEKAMEILKKEALDGEIVLLSPASASWDQYDKFETRGEEFKKLVEKFFN